MRREGTLARADGRGPGSGAASRPGEAIERLNVTRVAHDEPLVEPGGQLERAPAEPAVLARERHEAKKADL